MLEKDIGTAAVRANLRAQVAHARQARDEASERIAQWVLDTMGAARWRRSRRPRIAERPTRLLHRAGRWRLRAY